MRWVCHEHIEAGCSNTSRSRSIPSISFGNQSSSRDYRQLFMSRCGTLESSSIVALLASQPEAVGICPDCICGVRSGRRCCINMLRGVAYIKRLAAQSPYLSFLKCKRSLLMFMLNTISSHQLELQSDHRSPTAQQWSFSTAL